MLLISTYIDMEFMLYPKIVVLGNIGAGKSTLAAGWQRAYDLPLLCLDSIYWLPDVQGKQRNLSDARARLAEFLALHDRWIIEGCQGELLEDAVTSANCMIYLDTPLIVCQQNHLARPWEPEKYVTADHQERLQQVTLELIENYYCHVGFCSRYFHDLLFDNFLGKKIRL